MGPGCGCWLFKYYKKVKKVLPQEKMCGAHGKAVGHQEKGVGRGQEVWGEDKRCGARTRGVGRGGRRGARGWGEGWARGWARGEG